MGRIIAVEYHVPVLCWVDIEEGTISSVAQFGDLIEPTGKVFDEDANEITDKGAFEVATQIADSEDWPVWGDGL